MIKFDTIVFGRIFKNFFGQFLWMEKSHSNSHVSLNETPTENDHFEKSFNADHCKKDPLAIVNMQFCSSKNEEESFEDMKKFRKKAES